MSLYSNKSKGAGAVQPWSQVVTLAEAGKGCGGLFNLYESLGDKTLVGVNTVTTLLDGPEKVVRYGTLMLGDGTAATSLTASQRCKGLTILCDSLTVKNNATLQMTGRGARVLTGDDPFFPFVDYRIPFKIVLDSSRVTLAQALGVIRSTGLAPWDMGTFQHVAAAMFGFNLTLNQAGTLALLLASGCGDGATGASCGSSSNSPGVTGAAGANGGMGGGGSGGIYQAGTNTLAWSAKGGKGCPYSGGSGSGGVSSNTWLNNYHLQGCPLPSRYSGPGGLGGAVYNTTSAYADTNAGTQTSGSGGSGNPGGQGAQNSLPTPGNGINGGDGCGGKLTVICRGTVTVQNGGKIEANGVASGSAATASCNGGGSGGGGVYIITPTAGNLSNTGTIQAAGGSGGTDSTYIRGGAGGAGSVVTKTFSDMGW